MAQKNFEFMDYFIFSFMLTLSAVIGIYFGFFSKKKQNTPLEYLLGGKTMGVFPISMSLIASYISGISLIGIPSEIYNYGTQYMVCIISEYFVCATIAAVFLPVFYKLQITSSYEYLKLRFNCKVHILGSCLFIIKMLLILPVVVYVPALSFSQVTGLDLHLTTAIVCLICIFYTTLGGLKAVVWTDTIQLLTTIAGMLAVLYIGIEEVGIEEIIARNRETNRIEFDNFSFDPTVRHTFWGLTIGNYFYWLANCTVNQSLVQRYLAMPNKKMANWSIFNFAVGMTFLMFLCSITGLVVYAYYYDCDPLTAKEIRKADQILPYFAMDVGSKLPGLPGLFVSSIFGAALSTMSSGLNSMTGVIFQDLIRPIIGPISDAKASLYMKIIVFIVGLFCVSMVFMVDNLGALIQAGKSLGGITTGPLLGLFTLGMFFPCANSHGAMVGGVTGLLLASFMSLFSQSAIVFGLIKYEKKPLYTYGCHKDDKDLSIDDYIKKWLSKKEVIYDHKPEAPWLFKISYLWLTLIGTVTVLITGLLVSYSTGSDESPVVNKDLITPLMHRFLPEPKEKLKVHIHEREEEEEM